MSIMRMFGACGCHQIPWDWRYKWLQALGTEPSSSARTASILNSLAITLWLRRLKRNRDDHMPGGRKSHKVTVGSPGFTGPHCTGRSLRRVRLRGWDS